MPCLLIIPLITGISAFFAWIFWLLWGFVLVPVFHAPSMTFYQAWALWLLLAMLGNIFRATKETK